MSAGIGLHLVRIIEKCSEIQNDDLMMMICRFKKSHCLLKSSVPLPQFLCPIAGNFKRRFKRSPNDSGEMFNFFDDWYVYLVSIQTASVRGASQRFATNFLPVKIIWNRKNIIIIWARITSRKVSLLRRCRVCITQIIMSMDYCDCLRIHSYNK